MECDKDIYTYPEASQHATPDPVRAASWEIASDIGPPDVYSTRIAQSIKTESKNCYKNAHGDFGWRSKAEFAPSPSRSVDQTTVCQAKSEGESFLWFGDAEGGFEYGEALEGGLERGK